MNRGKGQGSRFKAHGALFYLLLVSSTLFLLSACGFHPRGALSLPPGAERIYLAGVDPSVPLARDIAMLYTRSGGTVVDKRNEASAVLEILRESSDRRVAAVNADGRVSQFELYYALTYRLLDTSGEVIHAESSVGVTRDYAFDPSNVLGKAQEEGLLRDDMRQQAIGQMLRQLARGTRLKPVAAPPAEPAAPPPAETPADAPTP